MKTFARMITAILLAGIFLLVAGLVTAQDSQQFLYTCKCGKKCDCNAIETQPGNCPCGKKLEEKNILDVAGEKAIVCDCGGGCVCDLSGSDPEMCSCGIPVGEISLKGLYACACGPECSCNTVSKEPGKCPCGKELQLVE